MQFSYRGIDIYYETLGEGQPLLMIHGGGPDHRLMKGCMEPNFDQDSKYKRIYFDLPGMGYSTVADWITNADDMLEVVLQFIDFIIPNETFLLAGESYGGYLSRGVMKRMSNRIEGLLMICPVIKPPNDRILPERTVLLENSGLLGSISKEDRELYESIAVIQDKDTWERYKKNIIPGLRLANYKFLEKLQSEGYAFSFDVDSMNEKFDKPVLLIAGRQDANVGYKDAWSIMDNYPRGSYVVLDRAGHCLENEQKVVFECLTKEWLMRCEECMFNNN